MGSARWRLEQALTVLRHFVASPLGSAIRPALPRTSFPYCSPSGGLDPDKDIEWRQYPADLLALAVEKGEVHALADLWLKDGKLNEVATNSSDEFADRACCVMAVRGSLVRDERAAATALTQAALEAGDHVAHNPADAAAVFSSYGGKGSVDDLTAMLKSHTHHDHPVGSGRACFCSVC